MRLSLLEQQVKEKFHFSDNWSSYSWEHKTTDRLGYSVIVGAIAPLITRGKNKDKRNWKKQERDSQRVVTITDQEHKDWLDEWEQRTGKCSRCEGNGKTIASFSIETGIVYRECFKCKGTGKSSEVSIQEK